MRLASAVLLATLAAACSSPHSTQQPPAEERAPVAPQVDPTPPPVPAAKIAASEILAPPTAEIRNVRLHVTPHLALDVRRLRGKLVSLKPNKPPVFDDSKSFEIHIASAEISVTGDSMAALMNDHVLAVPDPPLHITKIKIERGLITVHATIADGAVPVTMEGYPQAQADGTVRVRTTKLKIAGIPSKKLSERIGVKAGKIIGLDPERGARFDGNDLILDASKAVPPPRIKGKVREASIEGDRLILRFGPREALPKILHGPNFLRFTGGRLVFGKLTMDATDMELDDSDPSDIFDFDVPGQQKQLVAGWHRTTPANGLLVEMPDANDLARAKR